jgi:predicted GNAT family acetyltransferase
MQTEVRNNPQRSRYELFVDGELTGVADYAVAGQSVVMPHTEITAGRRGEGLGAVLVQAALEDVRRQGKSVVPHCWYVAEFIGRHPEFRDLLAA